MERYHVVCFAIAMLLVTLSGCAGHQPTHSGHELVAPPANVAASDLTFLRGTVKKKVEDLSLASLHAVNDFIDAHVKSEVLGREIMVLSVERHGFPFFLEGVMRSNPLLKELPRSKERILVLASDRLPGVENVFYTVYADEIPEGMQVANHWAPLPEVWNKHVDPTVNMLEGRSPEQAFLTLFYEGNIRINPDLIISVRGTDGIWDWSRMAHPAQTGFGVMVIPIATVKNGAMEALLK